MQKNYSARAQNGPAFHNYRKIFLKTIKNKLSNCFEFIDYNIVGKGI